MHIYGSAVKSLGKLLQTEWRKYRWSRFIHLSWYKIHEKIVMNEEMVNGNYCQGLKIFYIPELATTDNSGHITFRIVEKMLRNMRHGEN